MQYLKLFILSSVILFSVGCSPLDNIMQNLGAMNVKQPQHAEKKSTVSIPSDKPLIAKTSPKENYKPSNKPECVKTQVAKNLNFFNAPKDTAIISKAYIENIKSTCFNNENGIIVDLAINFKLELKNDIIKETPKKIIPLPGFFIAVISPYDEIISKYSFNENLTQKIDKNKKLYYKTAHKYINIINIPDGEGYKVVAGFQLSKEQLENNRSQTKVSY